MTPQVFINFRGEEMRKTFVSHLRSAFNSKHITSYIASEPFDDLDHEAMEQSRVAISVISMKNAISDMWFDDLRKIIECEKIGILRAIPIFFEVNPLDILSHAAANYTATQDETMEMVRRWMNDQVSSKSSLHSSDWEDDSELVDNITSFVSDFLKSSESSYHNTLLNRAPRELESAPSLYINPDTCHWLPSKPSISVSRSLTSGFWDEMLLDEMSLDGVFEVMIERFREDDVLHEYDVQVFSSLFSHVQKLKLEDCVGNLRDITFSADSTVIGMFGMEGVGKTTLARQLYKEISPQYHHHVYYDNFTTSSQRAFSFFDMFPNEDFQESRFHGRSDEAIKEMMRHRKVLLVADGVDDIKHLKYLMEMARWFGPGSRIIVITEDRSLLTECGVKHIYEVECPRYDEALAFFSEFAFKRSNPLPSLEELSFRAVHVANRLPLALKMLGSFLRDKMKDEWVSTLRRLEASRDSYASEVNRYIGADDYAPRRPIKVDRHIGVDEANCFPLYCLALE